MSEHDIDPNKAIDFLYTQGREYALAKANRVHLEEFRKSRKSMLMKAALASGVAKTSAAAEMEAYAADEYIKLLDNIKTAVEEEERLRWALVAAQARVDVWRSLEASNRVLDKSLS